MVIITGGSLILQYSKHTNRWFFENSNDRTTLVYSGNLDWARFWEKEQEEATADSATRISPRTPSPILQILHLLLCLHRNTQLTWHETIRQSSVTVLNRWRNFWMRIQTDFFPTTCCYLPAGVRQTDGPTKDGKLLVSPWTAKEESERKRWAERSPPPQPLFLVGSLMYFLSWKNEKKFSEYPVDTPRYPLGIMRKKLRGDLWAQAQNGDQEF